MFPFLKVEEVGVEILVATQGPLFSGESLSIARRVFFVEQFFFFNKKTTNGCLIFIICPHSS